MLEEIVDISDALELLDPRSVVYFLVTLIVFFVAKKSFDLLAPYDVSAQLTREDNKAVALAFAGYLFAVGGVLVSVLSVDANENLAESVLLAWALDIASTVAWCVGGIALIHAARLVNDKVLFRTFRNVKEIVEDRNIGTGAVEAGSYIGSGLIIQAALAGESDSVIGGVLSAVSLFVVGQILFMAFGALYQRTTRFDIHAEIEKDNVAAGISVGLNMTAIGVLLSGYITYSSSLPGLALWFVLGVFLLIVSRYMVDKFMLPGDLLDEEIARDRNWGAAFVEGISALTVALIVNACFL